MIHLCLVEDYPDPVNASYIDDLDYTAFNEGFARGDEIMQLYRLMR